MKNYNKLLSLLITVALVYWGCEEPIEQEDETILLRNSLNDPDMGDVGSLSGYFFNFTNGFNIKYNRYDANSVNNPDLFDPEEDTLNFRSYAVYTLENGESNLTGYEVITPEMIADSGYADLTPIDSLRKNIDINVEGLVKRLSSLSPAGTMQRGYAVVQNHETNELITDSSVLSVNDKTRINLAQGAFIASVNSVSEVKNE